jgi:hypothetical protein
VRNNNGSIARASPKSPAKALPKSPARALPRSPEKVSPKRTRKNLHPNLTEENLENLHTVNLSANEWRIVAGNNKSKEYIPMSLRYLGPKQPAPLKVFGKLPAFMQNKSK